MKSLWKLVAAASLALVPATLQAEPAKIRSGTEEQAVHKTQALLDETRISIKEIDLPLDKMLETLEKQLPDGAKLALRIDGEAFGKDRAKIAATPIHLPNLSKISLSTALRLVRHQISTPNDYRYGADEFVITTPARALYTVDYPIGDLNEKSIESISPDLLGRAAPGRPRRETAPKAAALVQLIASTVAPESWYPTTEAHGAIQIVDGNHLVVQANAPHHAEIHELLAALRRLNDVSVTVEGRLYAVDKASYAKIAGFSRVMRIEETEQPTEKPIEEGENVAAKPWWEKAKLVRTGTATRIANGRSAAFLSQHDVIFCPPLIRDKKLVISDLGLSHLTEPQTVLEGVSFQTSVVVSADRRFVRMKITEKAVEVDELPKALPEDKVRLGDDKTKEKEAAPDIQEQVDNLLAQLRRAPPLEPIVSDTVHSYETEIPDGGSRVFPVSIRPRSLQAANRWWVLIVSPRIVIEEEERAVREIALKQSLPALLTDLLTNPRLKAMRAVFGSPDDNRFALVPSESWSWTQGDPPIIPDHTQVKASRMGKRLLGIRIDDFQCPPGKDSPDLIVTVSLLNAGGTENGEAPGVGRYRYTSRLKEKVEKVHTVELAEPEK